MIGETHKVSDVDGIDRHLCINIERVRSPDPVIYLHKEGLHLAIVVLVDDLTTILDDKFVLLYFFKGEKADELVAQERRCCHHFLCVTQGYVHIHAKTLRTAVLTSIRIAVSFCLATQAGLIRLALQRGFTDTAVERV